MLIHSSDVVFFGAMEEILLHKEEWEEYWLRTASNFMKVIPAFVDSHTYYLN